MLERRVGDRRVGDRRVSDRRVDDRRVDDRRAQQEPTPRRFTVLGAYMAVLGALIAAGMIVLVVLVLSFVQAYKANQRMEHDQRAAVCRVLQNNELCQPSR